MLKFASSGATGFKILSISGGVARVQLTGKLSSGGSTAAGRSGRSLRYHFLLFPAGRPAAPMAGARTSHRPMVTTIEVR